MYSRITLYPEIIWIIDEFGQRISPSTIPNIIWLLRNVVTRLYQVRKFLMVNSREMEFFMLEICGTWEGRNDLVGWEIELSLIRELLMKEKENQKSPETTNARDTMKKKCAHSEGCCHLYLHYKRVQWVRSIK